MKTEINTNYSHMSKNSTIARDGQMAPISISQTLLSYSHVEAHFFAFLASMQFKTRAIHATYIHNTPRLLFVVPFFKSSA